MSIFSFTKKETMYEGVAEWNHTGGVLLDVRTREEYAEGYIKGSVNIPLQEIERVERIYPKDTILFVHCRSGARSGRAVAYLQQIGFTNVKNIGGIIDYHGEIERR